jgi:hypothetical protein
LKSVPSQSTVSRKKTSSVELVTRARIARGCSADLSDCAATRLLHAQGAVQRAGKLRVAARKTQRDAILFAPMEHWECGSVRRKNRQRVAASRDFSPYQKARDDFLAEPFAASWAHATVFGTRTIIAAPRESQSDSLGALAGVVWTVREIDSAHIPGSHGPRCLVYENSEVVRRIWIFPETWMTMPADALLRLAAIS